VKGTMQGRICHTEAPAAATEDCGNAIRERAAESCGFHQGQHLENARAEVERNGGAEGLLNRIVKRIERGDQ
jgi:hypothetical protein